MSRQEYSTNRVGLSRDYVYSLRGQVSGVSPFCGMGRQGGLASQMPHLGVSSHLVRAVLGFTSLQRLSSSKQALAQDFQK